MTRNLKVLGMALVAALAMSAVVASAASATGPFKFKSNKASPVLTAKQHGANDVFTTDAGTVSCSEATYVGSQPGTESEEAEVAPSYSGCTAFGFIGVPIHPNGCKYQFTTGTKTTTASSVDFEGSVHIVCPGANVIEITAPFGCTVTVGSQTPGGTVTYTNVGSGETAEITVDVNLSGIDYVEHDSNHFPCSGTTATKQNGTYVGSALVTGEDASKNHVGIRVE